MDRCRQVRLNSGLRRCPREALRAADSRRRRRWCRRVRHWSRARCARACRYWSRSRRDCENADSDQSSHLLCRGAHCARPNAATNHPLTNWMTRKANRNSTGASATGDLDARCHACHCCAKLRMRRLRRRASAIFWVCPLYRCAVQSQSGAARQACFRGHGAADSAYVAASTALFSAARSPWVAASLAGEPSAAE